MFQFQEKKYNINNMNCFVYKINVKIEKTNFMLFRIKYSYKIKFTKKKKFK